MDNKELNITEAEIRSYLESVEDELDGMLEEHEIKKVTDKIRKEIEAGDIHDDIRKHVLARRDFALVFQELFRRAKERNGATK